jgi:ech hydrogenase subunit F
MSVFSMGSTILRSLFSPPATRRYPTKLKEPRSVPGTRGRILIDVERCIFCMLCQKRCPTDAILVSKPQKEWTIERLRCCSCNACVEVCPTKCLTMDEHYSPVTVTRDKDAFRQAPKPPAAAAPAEGGDTPGAAG